MMHIVIISVTFHLLALLFLAVLLWERNWWRRESEALQRQAWKTQERLRQLLQDAADTQEELTSWEHKAADLWAAVGETEESR